MRLIRRTTLGAVAILIAVVSLVATADGSAQAHENISTVPDLEVTVEETAGGVILTLESEYPEVTLTVALEGGGVELVVIAQDEDILVEVTFTGESVTMTATSEDGTAVAAVIATPESVMWGRYSPEYNGEGHYP